MSVSLEEIGLEKLENMMSMMQRHGCHHLKLSDVEIDMSLECRVTPVQSTGPVQDEPPPTQRSGKTEDKPSFHGPVEIQTAPNGDPMPVIDPDLFALGHGTE